MASVYIFNSSAQPIVVTVNNGQPLTIAGTGPDQNWVPISSSPVPLAENFPSPGQFGPGANMLLVGSQPVRLDIQRLGADLQLFIFSEGDAWVVAQAGQVISAGL